MIEQRSGSFGLLPDDEREFLDTLANIESMDERKSLIEQAAKTRRQIENCEPVISPFEGFNPLEEDIESRIALFLYAQGLHRARLQEPLQTLRRIARS